MTDAKNPGAVEVTQADKEFAESISYMLEHPSMDVPKIAEKAARHRIAAQPAATAQEVGRMLDACAAYMSEQYGLTMLSHPVDQQRILASLAEPAAKAGDAEPGRMYPDDGGLKEPVRGLSETFNAFEMLRDHFYPDAVNPPSPQPDMGSVEKMTEALKNLTRFADDHGLEQERGGVAIMKAAWEALSLPHKEEATPAPVGEQGAVSVSQEMNDAWVNYEPIAEWREPMPLTLYCNVVRHAFMSGYVASRDATTERGRG